MKKISLHIYIVLGIFLIGFIIGSFVDLSLMESLFSENNTFGLVLSVIGTMPGYGCLAILGGGMFAMALKKDEFSIPYRFIFYVLMATGLVTSIFFAGREFFGVNGFSGAAPEWVGYLIALPVMAGLFYLGYRIAINSDNNRLWVLMIVLMIAIFIALVPGVTALKSIFHRPRYRIVVRYGYEEFHNWWQRCTNYKDVMAATNVGKDEFKSFPSGHVGAASVFMLCAAFLPLVNSKYERIQLPIFYAGLAWSLLIAFSRILVGAHFLSDVSMGGMLTTICLIVAYYVVMKGKLGLPKVEQHQAE